MAKRVTKRMLDAARLLAEGLGPKAVAEKLGCAESSVYRWMDDEDVLAEYRHCLRRGQIRAVAKAQRVLEKQMDSDAGNGFLAQNAASLITNKYADKVMGEDQQDITIHITGGMPLVGMPKPSESE